MSVFCKDENGCTIVSLIVSAVLGVIAAFRRITGVITVTPAFLWVVFGIAVVYLAVLLLVSPHIRRNGVCVGIPLTLTALVAGILGTVLFAVILLGVEFVTTSVIGAIVTGALVFFFFTAVSVTACLVRNIILCGSNQ